MTPSPQTPDSPLFPGRFIPWAIAIVVTAVMGNLGTTLKVLILGGVIMILGETFIVLAGFIADRRE